MNPLPLEFYATASDIADTPVLRDGLVLCFFLNPQVPKPGAAVQAVFDRWLEVVPRDLLEAGWYDTGGDMRDVRKGSIARLRKHLVSPRGKRWSGATFLTLAAQPFSAPAYQFATILRDHSEPSYRFGDTETSYVEMRFPSETLAEAAACDRWVAWAHEIAESLDYTSGYASLALQGSTGDRGDIYRARYIPPVAFRYPGLDIHDNAFTSHLIKGKIRGARWLTWMSPEILDRLGGLAAIQQALPETVETRAGQRGALLRLSPQPELGDLNDAEGMPDSLRALAHLAEPVTLFHDEGTRIYFGSPENRDRWERRFWET